MQCRTPPPCSNQFPAIAHHTRRLTGHCPCYHTQVGLALLIERVLPLEGLFLGVRHTQWASQMCRARIYKSSATGL